jgi:aspartate carbamoyltransferase regulatory subunit
MGLFNTSKKEEEDTEQIRRLYYKPTAERPNPFSIQVGQHFSSNGKRDALKVVEIVFRQDLLDKAGLMRYDTYVEIVEEQTIVKWKNYGGEPNLDVEYNIDF